jgi:excisionase family DNA binding protein
MNTSVDQLMTVPQLAEMLAVSEKTVRKWVFRREIPFVKLNGKSVRFSRLAIQKWMNQGAVMVS